ncbi:MAG: hypothetical protein AAB575_02785 [Patescibacteria group bacterium]
MPEQNNEALPAQAGDKVVDIFDGVDKAPEVAPSTNNSAPRVATSSTQPYVNQSLPVQSHKKFYIITGVVVLLLVLIVAVIASVKYVAGLKECSGPGCSPPDLKQDEQKVDEVVTPDVVVPAEVTTDTTTQELVVNVDTDKDGLTDAEEIAAGTNPVKTDSDSDGLFDYDEVKKFGTDPLNADTDGDGFLDGEEILGGYNPKGPGKLLNFEAEIGKMKTN